MQGKLEAGSLALPVDDSLLIVPLLWSHLWLLSPAVTRSIGDQHCAEAGKEELLLLEDGHCLKQQALKLAI